MYETIQSSSFYLQQYYLMYMIHMIVKWTMLSLIHDQKLAAYQNTDASSFKRLSQMKLERLK